MSGEEQQETDERGWLGRSVFPDGREPDPRFTLANERTFLAWTRTALAFLAGGIALEAFAIESLNPQVQDIAAILLVIVGLLIALGAATRWYNVERAMRHGRALPVPGIIPLLAAACVVGSVILLVGIL